jgi:hypothetical protein
MRRLVPGLGVQKPAPHPKRQPCGVCGRVRRVLTGALRVLARKTA